MLNRIVSIPISAFTSLTGTVPSTHIWAGTSGNVHELLTNNTGGIIGYLDGVLTSTIADAIPLYPQYFPGITSTISAFLVPPGNYTTTLSDATGTYIYTIGSLSGTLEFHGGVQSIQSLNTPTSATGSDQLSFSNDLQHTTLSANASAGQPLRLRMSRPQTNISKVYTLNNFQLVPNSRLTVNTMDSGLQLHSAGITITYDLRTDVVSTQTLAAFEYSGLTIAPSDVQTITFSNWDSMLTATLQVDHDGNGTVDEVIILPNQLKLYHIYLPIILH